EAFDLHGASLVVAAVLFALWGGATLLVRRGDPERRSLGDRVAGTRIVYRPVGSVSTRTGSTTHASRPTPRRRRRVCAVSLWSRRCHHVGSRKISWPAKNTLRGKRRCTSRHRRSSSSTASVPIAMSESAAQPSLLRAKST